MSSSNEAPVLRSSATSPTAVGADSRAVLGQTMGLVAVTLGFAALGASLGKDITGGAGLLALLVAFGCLIGLQAVVVRNEQLAIGLLFFVGLALGFAIGPMVNDYLKADPGVVYQAAGATGLFVGGLGAYGYATTRDVSSWGRYLLFALIGLILVGLVTLFVAIPGGNVVYAMLGLVVFGGLTIFDFNRLRRAGMESSVPIAASIFLDVVNVFQFFLLLFGGGGRR